MTTEPTPTTQQPPVDNVDESATSGSRFPRGTIAPAPHPEDADIGNTKHPEGKPDTGQDPQAPIKE